MMKLNWRNGMATGEMLHKQMWAKVKKIRKLIKVIQIDYIIKYISKL